MKKELVKIVTSGLVWVKAESIECILRSDIKEFDHIVSLARQRNSFVDYTVNKREIKSLILTETGVLFASGYKPETMIAKLNQANVQMISTIGTHSFLNVDAIESLVAYNGQDLDVDEYQNIYMDETIDSSARPIRALIYMKNHHIYPSTFNLKTLKKRIEDNAIL